DALYYVSSSEKIVESVSQSLQDKGIDAENIKHDILYGY
ncbi:oxidoreductase, partial [Lactobacillus salivarius]|nr:oxidoreductase [Ligilactobacillus salivarius]